MKNKIPNEKATPEISVLGAVVIVIGVIGLISLLYKGCTFSLSWFDSLPWFIYFPLGAAIAYVVYKFVKMNS